MIVVDANVIAYLLIMGDKTADAQRTFQKDPVWVVPTLWQHEVLNILATFARSGGATGAEVELIWQSALNLLASRTREADLEQTLQLASQQTVGAYDAQYVVLAQTLAVPLISEDRRLQRAFPTLVRSMQQFCDEA